MIFVKIQDLGQSLLKTGLLAPLLAWRLNVRQVYLAFSLETLSSVLLSLNNISFVVGKPKQNLTD